MNKIFRCRANFIYARYLIEVILTAKDKFEAKEKFILKCLHNYKAIITLIDFKLDYNDEEYFVDNNGNKILPHNFHKDNIEDFEKWLRDNIHEDNINNIECLGESSFQLVDKDR